MVKTLSRRLSRKTIMSNDGIMIGIIKNVMVDLDTGQVVDLIVKPDETFNTTGCEMDGERMLIPFESVKDIRDYVVVDRYMLKKAR